MPIYAYKCASCGHAKDVLQKMSDDPLSICPACGQASFQKQLTAAGFQLKGSGWYVTDFRGGNGGTTAPAVAGAENGRQPCSGQPGGTGRGGASGQFVPDDLHLKPRAPCCPCANGSWPACWSWCP